MLFGMIEADQDSFSALLDNPGTKFEDVLLHKLFFCEVKLSSPRAFEYLTSEASVRKLIQYSLSIKDIEAPNFHTLSKNSTSLLSFPEARMFFNFYSTSKLVISGLNAFLDEKEWDPLCAGNFSRIMCSFIDNKTDFLNNFDSLMRRLLNHVSNLSIAEMISILISKYYHLILGDRRLSDYVCEVILKPETPAFNLIYMLDKIVKDSWPNQSVFSEVIKDFSSDKFVSSLINLAKSTKSRIVSIEALRFLSDLNKTNPTALVFHRGCFGEFTNISCAASAYAFKAKTYEPAEGIRMLFTPDPHWGVCNSIIKNLNNLTPEEYMSEFQKSGVEEQLVKNAKKGEITPQQLCLIKKLHDASNMLNVALDFMKGEAMMHYITKSFALVSSFGGQVQSLDSFGEININID